MASYLILGAGKFGRLALQRLAAQDREARSLVVDRQAAALAGAGALGLAAEMQEADAIQFLLAHLTRECPWDWLVPMIPIHVAWAWLRAGPLAGGDWESAAVPPYLERLAALVVAGPEGELYLSRAQHLCPDDCPEPAVCPVSGEDREPPLYRQLAELSLPGVLTLVVASRNLAPGVGGYAPQRLLELAEAVTKASEMVLVVTACRCHGVVHGLRRRGARPA